MAFTKLELKERSKGFEATLSPKEQQLLQSLRVLLRQQNRDLRWYYRLGKEVALFRGELPRFKYGQARMSALARTLGCSDTLMTKSLAFVEQFPDEADVDQLTQLGVQWSHLLASLTLPDRQQRLALLHEAVKGDWTVARMRLEVRQRVGGSQRPGTGRPPRGPHAGAPEVELEDLIGKANQWDRFLEATWLAEEGVLARLQETCDKSADNSLQEQLHRASEALAKVSRRIQKVRKELKAMTDDGQEP